MEQALSKQSFKTKAPTRVPIVGTPTMDGLLHVGLTNHIVQLARQPTV